MRTAIATDTNSGITAQEGKQLGIYVLPMPVIIEGKSYMEGMDITHQELYTAMKQGKDVTSSQPSPGMLLNLWDSILREGYDELVYIPMSSGLSGSCHNAIQFAKDYNGKVQVVDNHRISVALKGSVLDARYLAAQGCTASKIKQILEEHAFDSSIYITVNSLEYLKKSGRVTAAAAAIATVVNLKPVLTIQGEKLDSYAKVRGMKQAERRMLEATLHDRKTRFAHIPDHQLMVGAAGTFEHAKEAQAWCQKIQETFPSIAFSYSPLPCNIACHVGQNAVGTGIIRIEGPSSHQAYQDS